MQQINRIREEPWEMSRKQKRILREKVGTWVAGIGFMMFLIFGSAIDGPGNDMRVVYTGIVMGMTIFAAGATIGGFWDC